MDTLKALLKKAGPFLTAIFLALTTLSVGNNLFIKKAPDVRLTAALISDTHVGDAFYRQLSLPPGLRDISRRVKPDVLVLAGDCTDNGNEANWTTLQTLFQKNADVPNTILAVGNHDCWTSYDGEKVYDEAKANFLQYGGAIMGETPDDVFFLREIGGYSFLVLGSEAASTDCVMTDRQLGWLEATLAAAAEKADGKPVFVINHQPMNFTHAVGADEGGNGFDSQQTSDRLQAILDQYPNIFYFCGHQHYPLALDAAENELGFATVERVGQHITSVNLPCYGYGTFLEGGTSVFGQGLVMYVFDDHVQFKGRNFFLSNWSRDFDVSVPVE
ncbi:MAG: metallophosphoesterase [Clostridia bacterium]|nr:metallophosphoesterase [Clostridia bacterium]